jgi:hypothetical protein
MNRFIIYCLVIFAPLNALSIIQQEKDKTVKGIIESFRSGDANDLSKYMNSMLDLSLPGYDDSYSSQQASRIVAEFFSKNSVQSFTVLKQTETGETLTQIIGELKCKAKTYQVSILIRKSGNQYRINQIKIN